MSIRRADKDDAIAVAGCAAMVFWAIFSLAWLCFIIWAIYTGVGALVDLANK